VVHPGDEGAVAPAREHGVEAARHHGVGDAMGVVVVAREEEVFGGYESGKRGANARAHLPGVGIEKDRGLLGKMARGVAREHRVPCARV
jgi:hypothetical protein